MCSWLDDENPLTSHNQQAERGRYPQLQSRSLLKASVYVQPSSSDPIRVLKVVFGCLLVIADSGHVNNKRVIQVQDVGGVLNPCLLCGV